MTFNKPCLTCGTLIRGASYCPTHQPAKPDSPERKAKKATLYGGDYRRRANAVKRGATHCYLCGKQFMQGEGVEADHIFPGDPNSPLAPAHRKCNQQKSNKQPDHR